MSRGSRAFTLIEALVAITLVGVGIAAAMSGMAHLSAAQYRSREIERMQRLAVQKYDEMVAVGTLESANLSGDFSDYSQPDYEWKADVQPTTVENLDSLTITVDRRTDDNGPAATIDGLVYQPPAAAAPAGGQQ
jgi:prepilin-type N-terminal cleavage/methylation domain-containing protein